MGDGGRGDVAGGVVRFDPTRVAGRRLSPQQRYMAVAIQQKTERITAPRNGRPNPTRIRMAFNLKNEYGPEVDRACGVEEPTVDRPEQVEAIGAYTGFPAAFFYLPDPTPVQQVWICREDGCEYIDNRPDADVMPIARETLW